MSGNAKTETSASLVTERVIKNTVFNGLGMVAGVAVNLIIVPIIVSHLGLTQYGIWVIIGVFTNYFGLADSGVSAAFNKYISEFHAKRDWASLNMVINTGLLIYVLLGVVLLLVSFPLCPWILRKLSLPVNVFPEALRVFRIVVLAFVLQNSLYTFLAVIEGLQRYDVANKIRIFVSVAYGGGVILAMVAGLGLYGLSIVRLLVVCIAGLLFAVAAYRLLPELQLRPLFVRFSVLRLLISFGYKIWVSKLATLISFQTDRVLVALFLPLSLVSYLDVGARVSFLLREVMRQPSDAIVPAASQVSAVSNSNSHTMEAFHHNVMKYMNLLCLPIAFLGLASFGQFVALWMGPDFEMASNVGKVLLLGYVVNAYVMTLAAIATGAGKPEFQMRYASYVCVFNISLSIVLLQILGFYGVAIGTTVALLIGGYLYFRMFYGYFQYARSTFLVLLAKPAVASGLAVVVYILVGIILHHILPPEGRWMGQPLGFAIQLGLAVISYLILIDRLRYLSEQDKGLLCNGIPLLGALWRRSACAES